MSNVQLPKQTKLNFTSTYSCFIARTLNHKRANMRDNDVSINRSSIAHYSMFIYSPLKISHCICSLLCKKARGLKTINVVPYCFSNVSRLIDTVHIQDVCRDIETT